MKLVSIRSMSTPISVSEMAIRINSPECDTLNRILFNSDLISGFLFLPVINSISDGGMSVYLLSRILNVALLQTKEAWSLE